jgi:hypothetical protein
MSGRLDIDELDVVDVLSTLDALYEPLRGEPPVGGEHELGGVAALVDPGKRPHRARGQRWLVTRSVHPLPVGLTDGERVELRRDSLRHMRRRGGIG